MVDYTNDPDAPCLYCVFWKDEDSWNPKPYWPDGSPVDLMLYGVCADHNEGPVLEYTVDIMDVPYPDDLDF